MAAVEPCTSDFPFYSDYVSAFVKWRGKLIPQLSISDCLVATNGMRCLTLLKATYVIGWLGYRRPDLVIYYIIFRKFSNKKKICDKFWRALERATMTRDYYWRFFLGFFNQLSVSQQRLGIKNLCYWVEDKLWEERHSAKS